MKAIKVMATIDNQGQLCIDEPLKLEQNSRVEAPERYRGDGSAVSLQYYFAIALP